uniref:Potassium channel tetramerisation-type BTB domain-containing protein n=1 Tax=Acrobeloides nanus TaxID=290746 RepID=A0A914C8U9_9BILA
MVTGEVPVTMDSEGYILIDRDGTYFNLILNFMRDGEVDISRDYHILKLIQKEADYYGFQELVDYIQESENFSTKKAIGDTKQIKTLLEFCEITESKKPVVVITYSEPFARSGLLTLEAVNKLRKFLKSYPDVNVYNMQMKGSSYDDNRYDKLYVFAKGSKLYSETILYSKPVTISYNLTVDNRLHQNEWWNKIKNELTVLFNKAY